jgi:hypothetical protein
VQEQDERQRPVGIRAAHDSHAARALAAALVHEVAAALGLQPAAAARQQRGEKGGERERAHRYS